MFQRLLLMAVISKVVIISNFGNKLIKQEFLLPNISVSSEARCSMVANN